MYQNIISRLISADIIARYCSNNKPHVPAALALVATVVPAHGGFRRLDTAVLPFKELRFRGYGLGYSGDSCQETWSTSAVSLPLQPDSKKCPTLMSERLGCCEVVKP